jgi:hypothetical protein
VISISIKRVVVARHVEFLLWIVVLAPNVLPQHLCCCVSYYWYTILCLVYEVEYAPGPCFKFNLYHWLASSICEFDRTSQSLSYIIHPFHSIMPNTSCYCIPYLGSRHACCTLACISKWIMNGGYHDNVRDIFVKCSELSCLDPYNLRGTLPEARVWASELIDVLGLLGMSLLCSTAEGLLSLTCGTGPTCKWQWVPLSTAEDWVPSPRPFDPNVSSTHAAHTGSFACTS